MTDREKILAFAAKCPILENHIHDTYVCQRRLVSNAEIPNPMLCATPGSPRLRSSARSSRATCGLIRPFAIFPASAARSQ